MSDGLYMNDDNVAKAVRVLAKCECEDIHQMCPACEWMSQKTDYVGMGGSVGYWPADKNSPEDDLADLKMDEARENQLMGWCD